jgi:hypothetical protein
LTLGSHLGAGSLSAPPSAPPDAFQPVSSFSPGRRPNFAEPNQPTPKLSDAGAEVAAMEADFLRVIATTRKQQAEADAMMAGFNEGGLSSLKEAVCMMSQSVADEAEDYLKLRQVCGACWSRISVPRIFVILLYPPCVLAVTEVARVCRRLRVCRTSCLRLRKWSD